MLCISKQIYILYDSIKLYNFKFADYFTPLLPSRTIP